MCVCVKVSEGIGVTDRYEVLGIEPQFSGRAVLTVEQSLQPPQLKTTNSYITFIIYEYVHIGPQHAESPDFSPPCGSQGLNSGQTGLVASALVTETSHWL